MKFLMAVAAFAVATLVYGENMETQQVSRVGYDEAYSRCLSETAVVSEARKKECHEKAKGQVLVTFGAFQQLADCREVGLSEVECLRQNFP